RGQRRRRRGRRRGDRRDGVRGQGHRVHGVLPERGGQHPDPRRRRLHLGVRPSPLLQTRQGQRRALRQPGDAPRAGRPRHGVVSMDLSFSKEEEAFRREVREWLEANLVGPFEKLRGRGGPGDEHSFVEERIEWTKRMGEAGWNCIGWPKEHGGRGVTLNEEVIFNEEYVRARGPGRIGHIGETLLGPTLIHFGTEEQKARFLPPIVAGDELWCQGDSEPNAGSDLANLQTKATLVGDEWVIEGQKIWTSLAHWSQWIFVLARTDPSASKHAGISYLLVPMDQPGIEIRPIKQMTGDSEFAEV